MLLQRLIEHADRLAPQPVNYTKKQVTWVAEIDREGRWIGTGFVKLDKGREYIVPYIERSGKTPPPILLFDKPEFALGVVIGNDKNDVDQQKATAKHQSFTRLVEECASQTSSADVLAVLTALNLTDRPQVPKEMKSGDWILFRVQGQFPTDDRAVQRFWAARTARSTQSGDFMCVGCGQACTPEDRHRIPIPLRGGHGKGTKLISANDPAYASYGLTESLIAPTCADCVRKYATSLCYLLDSESNHFVIGKMTYLFWAKSPSDINLLLLQDPDPESVKRLLLSPVIGQTRSELDTADFYAVALSPNVSRVVVRDWMEATVGNVEKRLASWFRRQQIGGVERYHSLFALTSSFYSSRSKNVVDEMAPNVALYLLKHALYAQPLPQSLLLLALRRCVAEPADRKFTAPRMSFLKLYLLQTRTFEDGDLVALDEQRTEPGYVCGRVLAELERIQSLAVGNPNSSLVDRYYGTASTAPSTVFPYLISNAQNHLAKIRREKKGLFTILSREIAAIFDLMSDFPRRLLPEQQALFAIGYYHQQQHIRGVVSEMAQRKTGGKGNELDR